MAIDASTTGRSVVAWSGSIGVDGRPDCETGLPMVLTLIGWAQVIKAAGVTFAISAIERVIEEQARGDYSAAAEIREKVEAAIGEWEKGGS